MNEKHSGYFFYFHSTEENKNLIIENIKKTNIDNLDVVSDENIKLKILIYIVKSLFKN